MSTASKKIFISYRHSQQETARRVEAQLLAAGLAVFRDERDIAPTENISQRVKEGLAASHAMLVLLCDRYSQSTYCQWELTAAFTAAQQAGQPQQRVFVLLLGEDALLQALPDELAGARYLADNRALADQVKASAERLTGSFAELGAFTVPPYHGRWLTSSPRFAGRETEFWQLHSALQASQNPMITGHTGPDLAEVSGMGGIGKTLLAEEYALRFGAAYPGGIFWLDAYGSFNPGQPDIEQFKASCAEQFRKVALSLQLNPAADEELLALKARIAAALRKNGQRCLWIVDDIPQGLAGYQSTITNWFSPCPELAPTLVTTRSREYNAIGKELPLDVLTLEAARNLLTNNQLDLTDQQHDADQLIQQLGQHALALDIAGASIHKYQLTIAEYLQELADDNQELLEVPNVTVAALPAGHATSIIKTFQRSLKHLPPESLDILRLAANLAPAPIPHSLFNKVFEQFGLTPKKVRKALLGCAEAHLLSQQDKDWRLHALIAATLQHLEFTTDHKGQSLKQAAIEYLIEAIEHEGIDHQQAQALTHILEHGRYLTRQIKNEAEHNLLIRIGKFDYHRGNPVLATLCWQKIYQWQSDTYGEDHPDTLTSINNLAETLRISGDLGGSKARHEHVLARRRVVLGEDHPDTLQSIHNLASTLSDMGGYSGAKTYQEYVLARRKVVLGENHPDTLSSMNNLAETLRLMGDPSGAKAHHEDVLARSLVELGEDHPATLASINNLAQTLSAMGDHNGAKAQQERVLARFQAVLGEEHPSTLTSMSNLAGMLRDMGDHSGAKAHHEYVVARLQAVLGEDHPNTLVSINSFAQTLSAMGDYSGAQANFEHVLARRQAVLGENHPDTLQSINNLAHTLSAMGDHRDAKVHQEHVLARFLEILGEDHPDTLRSRNNLALTLTEMGDHSGAKAHHKYVLARRQEVLSERHPDIIVSAWNLFNTFLEMDSQAAARDIFQQHLQYLLEVDEAELTSADLRQIRKRLIMMIMRSMQTGENQP